ncbi:MAG: SHOCT domain-containing protein [Candidatus Limnocylindrales bacterium]
MTGIGWEMGLGGWVWMVAGIVLIVLIAWVVLAAIPRGDRLSDDAGRILKARFTRNEITEAEYEQARRLLGN